MSTKKMLKLKLVRSLNAVLPKHKMCVKGLGLTRMHQEVLVQDTACNRGMINKAYYLLSVEEV